MYDKNWSEIKKICTMSLFGNRCPIMNDNFKTFVRTNSISLTPGGYIPLKLSTYTQFVKNSKSYVQGHTAIQDTIDLFSVLKSAIKYDGCSIIDGRDYLVKPEWMRA